MAVDLSVAIIFKDEIRCLERCLKSLLPLRERLSCEIVMADTGASDGSRAVAEKYADVVFDFPWIDDFAAARNAVLERCTGQWTLMLDCDEWLGGDLSVLADFVGGKRSKQYEGAALEIRNYMTAELERYNPTLLTRVLNMARRPYYAGALHEELNFKRPGTSLMLNGVFLHHDGYVMLNDGSAAGRQKHARNMRILRGMMEEEPTNLLRYLQAIESGVEEEDFDEILRRGVELTEQKESEWERFGPPIFRYAITNAYNKDLPELDALAQKALNWFPDSYFIRLDVNYLLWQRAWRARQYETSILFGEAYLKARAEGAKDPRHALETGTSAMQRDNAYWDQTVYIGLADARARLGQPQRAAEELGKLDFTQFGAADTEIFLATMQDLAKRAELDVSRVMSAFWRGACVERKNKALADECRSVFLKKSGEMLAQGAWQLLLPLSGQCPAGSAAALLAARTPEEADAALARAGDLAQLPAAAIVHAMKLGAEFPPGGEPMALERMELLASKLAEDGAFLREALLFTADAAEEERDVLWAHALANAMIDSQGWNASGEAFALLCAFVRAESAFLTLCYTRFAMEQNACLPPAHRFALHMANAFATIAPNVPARGFAPSAPTGLRAALEEFKRAVETMPERKSAVDLVLAELTDKGG